ncbi:MAG: helix-turn-helix domain-containing protein [Clostridium sp.]|nr:helix-turn-helix domain-containing protein [Clostridium sp.]
MTQAEKIYMISDAARQVEVEAHVLRYWEEELEMPAKRNEMGHRYYTEEDIARFRRVKELKEQGLQLKAIRHVLKNGNLQMPVFLYERSVSPEKGVQDMQGMSELQGAAMQSDMDMSKRHVVMVKKGEFLPMEEKAAAISEESREQKSFRLQQLLKDMIAEAVQSNNQEICQEIKESLLKEMDYQFRLLEEREDIREEDRVNRQEEHYRQIDELLRSYNQRGRKGKKLRREQARKKAEAEAEKKAEADGGKEKNQGTTKGFLRKKHSVV